VVLFPLKKKKAHRLNFMTEKTLIIQDPVLKRGFTATPNIVLTAPGLSLGAKAFYSMLRMFAWQRNECWPGQEKLAEAAGCHVNTVEKYLKELKNFGLISWKRQGLNRPNIYYIHDLTAIERLKTKDSQILVNPESQGIVNQESQGIVDKEYSVNNVVVGQTDGTNYQDREERLNCPDTLSSENILTEKKSSSEKSMVSNIGQKPILEINRTIGQINTVANVKKGGVFSSGNKYLNSEAEELRALVNRICGTDIPSEFFSFILKDYDKENILEKLKLLKGVEVENVPGWLIAALKNNFKCYKTVKSDSNKSDSKSGFCKREINSSETEGKKAKKELLKKLYMN